jgi:ABC-type transporter Mla subunit MlaD
LGRARRRLERTRRAAGGEAIDPDVIANAVMSQKRLAHLWSEFRQTLHPQKEVDDIGQERVVRWRATALAEVFFTDQAIVEAPLGAEFFRHLPGILTGIGIIGTFLGLITGLQQFDTDPARVQESLKHLIQNVGHAFFVSLVAIALAMVFTFLEKILLTAGYRQAARLREAIDSCFDAGASEEYLARLVHASETSATQAAHIKDALVADLGQILSDLTQRQVQATEALGRDIPAGLSQALAMPMEGIASAVQRLGANQGEAVSALLTDVLASFSAQMREMFGGQLVGINDLLHQTNSAMQSVVGRFDELANRLGGAGEAAAGAMADKLTGAMAAMEARQQALNQQMTDFVQQLRAMASDSQTETAAKLQQTVADLGAQVSAMVEQLSNQAQAVAAQSRATHAETQAHTKATLDGVSQQMGDLLMQSAQAIEAMRSTVSVLTTTTAETASRLGASTDALILAADAFATASRETEGAMKASTDTAEKLREVSQTLTAAAASTSQAMADFRATRDTFGQLVADLKTTVENARREASLTETLVAKLSNASEKLAAAQGQTEHYLEQVTEVLTTAHQSFADNVAKTLHSSNSDFHEHLTTATGYLSSAIRELGGVVDEIIDGAAGRSR